MRNKGITLVALVITIIILLILAGVTLQLSLGENGLFKMTKNATSLYGEKSKEEENELKELEKQLGNITTKNTTLINTVKTTAHDTIKGEDRLGNPVVIPGGFKFAGNSDDTVEDGIIIEDDIGNQFVWVPVSNINGNSKVEDTDNDNELIKLENGNKVEITLGRYTFKRVGDADTGYTDGTSEIEQKGSEREKDIPIYTNFQEGTNIARKNGGEEAKSLEDFITSVETNHGYYLARYEAGRGTDNKAVSKVGETWREITQQEATVAAKNMYNELDSEAKYIESDLVNSYAWDTAIVYIQAMGNTNYANQGREDNTILKDTGKTGDVKCNIYDMAGNNAEWTTEYSKFVPSGVNYPCVRRGGGYFDPKAYVFYRVAYQITATGRIPYTFIFKKVEL